MNNKELFFAQREEFRSWLNENSKYSNGVWLIFQKGKTLSATEALEEALCFGWIDGLMQNISKDKYKKYFAKRTAKSKWSEKNKKIVMELVAKGLVMEEGISAINTAKGNGMWDKTQKNEVTDQQKKILIEALQDSKPAAENFLNMSASVQKNYILMYFDAKTEETKLKRLKKIIDRLEKNLKPM